MAEIGYDTSDYDAIRLLECYRIIRTNSELSIDPIWFPDPLSFPMFLETSFKNVSTLSIDGSTTEYFKLIDIIQTKPIATATKNSGLFFCITKDFEFYLINRFSGKIYLISNTPLDRVPKGNLLHSNVVVDISNLGDLIALSFIVEDNSVKTQHDFVWCSAKYIREIKMNSYKGNSSSVVYCNFDDSSWSTGYDVHSSDSLLNPYDELRMSLSSFKSNQKLPREIPRFLPGVWTLLNSKVIDDVEHPPLRQINFIHTDSNIYPTIIFTYYSLSLPKRWANYFYCVGEGGSCGRIQKESTLQMEMKTCSYCTTGKLMKISSFQSEYDTIKAPSGLSLSLRAVNVEDAILSAAQDDEASPLHTSRHGIVSGNNKSHSELQPHMFTFEFDLHSDLQKSKKKFHSDSLVSFFFGGLTDAHQKIQLLLPCMRTIDSNSFLQADSDLNASNAVSLSTLRLPILLSISSPSNSRLYQIFTHFTTTSNEAQLDIPVPSAATFSDLPGAITAMQYLPHALGVAVVTNDSLSPAILHLIHFFSGSHKHVSFTSVNVSPPHSPSFDLSDAKKPLNFHLSCRLPFHSTESLVHSKNYRSSFLGSPSRSSPPTCQKINLLLVNGSRIAFVSNSQISVVKLHYHFISNKLYSIPDNDFSFKPDIACKRLCGDILLHMKTSAAANSSKSCYGFSLTSTDIRKAVMLIAARVCFPSRGDPASALSMHKFATALGMLHYTFSLLLSGATALSLHLIISAAANTYTNAWEIWVSGCECASEKTILRGLMLLFSYKQLSKSINSLNKLFNVEKRDEEGFNMIPISLLVLGAAFSLENLQSAFERLYSTHKSLKFQQSNRKMSLAESNLSRLSDQVFPFEGSNACAVGMGLLIEVEKIMCTDGKRPDAILQSSARVELDNTCETDDEESDVERDIQTNGDFHSRIIELSDQRIIESQKTIFSALKLLCLLCSISTSDQVYCNQLLSPIHENDFQIIPTSLLRPFPIGSKNADGSTLIMSSTLNEYSLSENNPFNSKLVKMIRSRISNHFDAAPIGHATEVTNSIHVGTRTLVRSYFTIKSLLFWLKNSGKRSLGISMFEVEENRRLMGDMDQTILSHFGISDVVKLFEGLQAVLGRSCKYLNIFHKSDDSIVDSSLEFDLKANETDKTEWKKHNFDGICDDEDDDDDNISYNDDINLNQSNGNLIHEGIYANINDNNTVGNAKNSPKIGKTYNTTANDSKFIDEHEDCAFSKRRVELERLMLLRSVAHISITIGRFILLQSISSKKIVVECNDDITTDTDKSNQSSTSSISSEKNIAKSNKKNLESVSDSTSAFIISSECSSNEDGEVWKDSDMDIDDNIGSESFGTENDSKTLSLAEEFSSNQNVTVHLSNHNEKALKLFNSSVTFPHNPRDETESNTLLALDTDVIVNRRFKREYTIDQDSEDRKKARIKGMNEKTVFSNNKKQKISQNYFKHLSMADENALTVSLILYNAVVKVVDLFVNTKDISSNTGLNLISNSCSGLWSYFSADLYNVKADFEECFFESLSRKRMKEFDHHHIDLLSSICSEYLFSSLIRKVTENRKFGDLTPDPFIFAISASAAMGKIPIETLEFVMVTIRATLLNKSQSSDATIPYQHSQFINPKKQGQRLKLPSLLTKSLSGKRSVGLWHQAAPSPSCVAPVACLLSLDIAIAAASAFTFPDQKSRVGLDLTSASPFYNVAAKMHYVPPNVMTTTAILIAALGLRSSIAQLVQVEGISGSSCGNTFSSPERIFSPNTSSCPQPDVCNSPSFSNTDKRFHSQQVSPNSHSNRHAKSSYFVRETPKMCVKSLKHAFRISQKRFSLNGAPRNWWIPIFSSTYHSLYSATKQSCLRSPSDNLRTQNSNSGPPPLLSSGKAVLTFRERRHHAANVTPSMHRIQQSTARKEKLDSKNDWLEMKFPFALPSSLENVTIPEGSLFGPSIPIEEAVANFSKTNGSLSPNRHYKEDIENGKLTVRRTICASLCSHTAIITVLWTILRIGRINSTSSSEFNVGFAIPQLLSLIEESNLVERSESNIPFLILSPHAFQSFDSILESIFCKRFPAHPNSCEFALQAFVDISCGTKFSEYLLSLPPFTHAPLPSTVSSLAGMSRLQVNERLRVLLPWTLGICGLHHIAAEAAQLRTSGANCCMISLQELRELLISSRITTSPRDTIGYLRAESICLDNKKLQPTFQPYLKTNLFPNFTDSPLRNLLNFPSPSFGLGIGESPLLERDNLVTWRRFWASEDFSKADCLTLSGDATFPAETSINTENDCLKRSILHLISLTDAIDQVDLQLQAALTSISGENALKIVSEAVKRKIMDPIYENAFSIENSCSPPQNVNVGQANSTFCSSLSSPDSLSTRLISFGHTSLLATPVFCTCISRLIFPSILDHEAIKSSGNFNPFSKNYQLGLASGNFLNFDADDISSPVAHSVSFISSGLNNSNLDFDKSESGDVLFSNELPNDPEKMTELTMGLFRCDYCEKRGNASNFEPSQEKLLISSSPLFKSRSSCTCGCELISNQCSVSPDPSSMHHHASLNEKVGPGQTLLFHNAQTDGNELREWICAAVSTLDASFHVRQFIREAIHSNRAADLNTELVFLVQRVFAASQFYESSLIRTLYVHIQYQRSLFSLLPLFTRALPSPTEHILRSVIHVAQLIPHLQNLPVLSKRFVGNLTDLINLLNIASPSISSSASYEMSHSAAYHASPLPSPLSNDLIFRQLNSSGNNENNNISEVLHACRVSLTRNLSRISLIPSVQKQKLILSMKSIPSFSSIATLLQSRELVPSTLLSTSSTIPTSNTLGATLDTPMSVLNRFKDNSLSPSSDGRLNLRSPSAQLMQLGAWANSSDLSLPLFSVLLGFFRDNHGCLTLGKRVRIPLIAKGIYSVGQNVLKVESSLQITRIPLLTRGEKGSFGTMLMKLAAPLLTFSKKPSISSNQLNSSMAFEQEQQQLKKHTSTPRMKRSASNKTTTTTKVSNTLRPSSVLCFNQDSMICDPDIHPEDNLDSDEEDFIWSHVALRDQPRHVVEKLRRDNKISTPVHDSRELDEMKPRLFALAPADLANSNLTNIPDQEIDAETRNLIGGVASNHFKHLSPALNVHFGVNNKTFNADGLNDVFLEPSRPVLPVNRSNSSGTQSLLGGISDEECEQGIIAQQEDNYSSARGEDEFHFRKHLTLLNEDPCNSICQVHCSPKRNNSNLNPINLFDDDHSLSLSECDYELDDDEIALRERTLDVEEPSSCVKRFTPQLWCEPANHASEPPAVLNDLPSTIVNDLPSRSESSRPRRGSNASFVAPGPPQVHSPTPTPANFSTSLDPSLTSTLTRILFQPKPLVSSDPLAHPASSAGLNQTLARTNQALSTAKAPANPLFYTYQYGETQERYRPGRHHHAALSTTQLLVQLEDDPDEDPPQLPRAIPKAPRIARMPDYLGYLPGTVVPQFHNGETVAQRLYDENHEMVSDFPEGDSRATTSPPTPRRQRESEAYLRLRKERDMGDGIYDQYREDETALDPLLASSVSRVLRIALPHAANHSRIPHKNRPNFQNNSFSHQKESSVAHMQTNYPKTSNFFDHIGEPPRGQARGHQQRNQVPEWHQYYSQQQQTDEKLSRSSPSHEYQLHNQHSTKSLHTVADEANGTDHHSLHSGKYPIRIISQKPIYGALFANFVSRPPRPSPSHVSPPPSENPPCVSPASPTPASPTPANPRPPSFSSTPPPPLSPSHPPQEHHHHYHLPSSYSLSVGASLQGLSQNRSRSPHLPLKTHSMFVQALHLSEPLGCPMGHTHSASIQDIIDLESPRTKNFRKMLQNRDKSKQV